MNTTQEQEIRLFDGECISEGCRGRRSDLPVSKAAGRWIAAIIAGLVIAFAGAATAIHRQPVQQEVTAVPMFTLAVSSHDDVLW
jgi:hypothetical protein